MAADTSGDVAGPIVTFFVVFVLYFVPAFIALARKHSNALAILALNLLLGWTCLGWVAALVWSLTAQTQSVETWTPGAVSGDGHYWWTGGSWQLLPESQWPENIANQPPAQPEG